MTLVTAKDFTFLQSSGKKPKLKSDDLQRCITAMRFVKMLVEENYLMADAEGKKCIKAFDNVAPVLREALLNSTSSIESSPFKPTSRPAPDLIDDYCG